MLLALFGESGPKHPHQRTRVTNWEEKGDSHLLPERPFGCFAQKVTGTFFRESRKAIQRLFLKR